MSKIAKPIAVFFFAALGIVLLVATKSVAGAACLCAAVTLLLPLNRFLKNERRSKWVRAGLVAVFSIVATASITGTDIVPEQATTGYKFIDQVLAILQRFQENVFGRGTH